MWNYEKRLQHPVKITQTNPKIAQVIISQFGGPDGELGASMRYLSQRYTMPYNRGHRYPYGYRYGRTRPKTFSLIFLPYYNAFLQRFCVFTGYLNPALAGL